MKKRKRQKNPGHGMKIPTVKITPLEGLAMGMALGAALSRISKERHGGFEKLSALRGKPISGFDDREHFAFLDALAERLGFVRKPKP